jgi:hypothetical protein
VILCAAAHDLCGDGIALCSGTAEHNRYLSFVACDGVAASAYANFVSVMIFDCWIFQLVLTGRGDTLNLKTS